MWNWQISWFPSLRRNFLRHTFCTTVANAGMNPKALQYIMGPVSYTHLPLLHRIWFVLFFCVHSCNHSFPFRGFGTRPNKQFSTDAPQDGRAKIRKRVLFSYACYETLSLTTYNTGNGKFDELSQKKNAAICDVSITLYKQKRENFIPPFRRCWLPLFLLQ